MDTTHWKDNRFGVVLFQRPDPRWRALLGWHVSAVLNDGVVWTLIDPHRGVPEIACIGAADMPLVTVREAYRVPIPDPANGVPLPMIGSCVSVVKWIFGINAPWVWTARQFRCYIRRRYPRFENQRILHEKPVTAPAPADPDRR